MADDFTTDPTQPARPTNSPTEQVKADAEDLRQDLREIGSHLKGAAGEKFEQLKGQARERYEQYRGQATGRARDYADQAKGRANEYKEYAGEQYDRYAERGQQTVEKVEQYVREKPVQSLLLAAGVGLVVGVLFKRS